MDRSQFDALARLVSTKGSRRTALAAVLGVTLLRHDPAAVLAKGKGKGKVKAQAKAKAKPKPCYPGTRCTPGKGKNTSGCDFSNSTIFQNKDARGSNLSNSNFTGADLAGADLRGANLSGGCFVDANLLGVKLGSSVNLGNAIFCNTVMPDGSINNSGCASETACCPTTCQGDNCPPGGCNGLDQLCGAIGGPCCPGQGDCVKPPISRCISYCVDNKECADRFPTLDVECEKNEAFCGEKDRKCCRNKSCKTNADCPQGHHCCLQAVCCFPGQSCGGTGCSY